MLTNVSTKGETTSNPPLSCVPKKPGPSHPLLAESQSVSLSVGVNYRHRLQSLFLLEFPL